MGIDQEGNPKNKYQSFYTNDHVIQKHSDHETPTIKLYTIRPLYKYIKKKSLIHGRQTAAISKLSAFIFDKYFPSLFPSSEITRKQYPS